ncbi:hypothetical protein [Sediminibacterium ginsengisoli]|uniref:ABC-2 type transport system permease protein n=1 Tax=Sediminibacterium ginsengisoli TaxID=413434 RepID=A0A1T4RXS3_9BACT|nr:hypothetical protein [Sediminibacterium ginsengisoli]SKA20548.1 hypothetical protein SAMN04488132_1167 [Sediminibacterium ginsengisoli]
MNIINRAYLFLLLQPSSLYRRMGVNTAQLKAILSTKLMMDDRRPNSLRQTQGKNENPSKFATIGTMIVSAVVGLLFLTTFFVGTEYITKLTLYFAIYIFMLAFTLISDFTSVLIDVRDTMIILPKPVNDKTFLLARLLHIIIHISKMMIPMTLPGLIYLIVKTGWGSVIPFMLMVGAATLFTIFLINAVYLVILRITTPARFKTVISYFQIFFAVFIYGSYQIVPRLINKALYEQFSIEGKAWAWLLPSYWFAGSWQFLYSFRFTWPHFISFLASIAVPALSIWAVVKYFAPSFNSKLAMISGSADSGPAATEKATKARGNTRTLSSRLASLITRPGAERMSFLLTWKMTGRSRDFKLKVYPAFGYMLVYLVIMFMNSNGLTLTTIRNQQGSGKFIFMGVTYFSSFILMMALPQLIYSDKYKAAWIYYTTPVRTPGELISGAVKATIVKFFVPVVLLITIAAVSVIGIKIIPNLLLGMANILLIASLMAYISITQLPFSEEQSNAPKGSFVRTLIAMFIPALLALLHYLLYQFMVVVIMLAVLSGIATWLVLDALRAREWTKLRRYKHG